MWGELFKNEKGGRNFVIGTGLATEEMARNFNLLVFLFLGTLAKFGRSDY
jgi:hypothetical protein